MGRRKLEKIPELDKAETRLAAIKSIDPDLDMGDGRDVRTYAAVITEARQQVSEYNRLLSTVDESYNNAIAAIAVANKLSSRMLSGIGSKYTTDSNEYEKAGGTRSSERKRPVRKAK